MQAMAMNGLTEYNEFFIDNFDSIFPQFLKAIELKQELSIAQILWSMVQLGIDQNKINKYEYMIGNIMNLLWAEITSDHAFIIAPLLWGLTCLDHYDEELFQIWMKTLDIHNITKFDAILLNQVFNELRQIGKLKMRDHYELQQLCREQSLRYEDELSRMRLKLISMYRGKDIIDQVEFAHTSVGNSQLKTNKVLEEIGYKVTFERENKRIFLVDKFIKNNNNKLNGYNMMKLKQIARQSKIDGFELIIKETDKITEILQNIDPQVTVDTLFNEPNTNN